MKDMKKEKTYLRIQGNARGSFKFFVAKSRYVLAEFTDSEC